MASGKLVVTLNGEQIDTRVDRKELLHRDFQTIGVTFEGKKAKITSGLLAEGLDAHLYKKYSGVTFIYSGKIIEYGVTDLEAFSGSNIGEVAFFVELLDTEDSKWLLSANKDMAMEKDSLMSSRELEETIKYWLARGEQKRQVVQMVELGTYITSLFTELFAKNRKRSSPENETGTVTPKDTGRKRTDTDKEGGKPRKTFGFNWDFTDRGYLMVLDYSKAEKLIRISLNYKHTDFPLLVGNQEVTKSKTMALIADFLVTSTLVNKQSLEDNFNGVSFADVFEGLSQSAVRVSIDTSLLKEEDE